jgi:hypothetical protein
MELINLPSDILRKIDSFLGCKSSIELRYSAPSLYADLKHRKQVDEKDNGYYYKKNGMYFIKIENFLDRELSTGMLVFDNVLITQEYVRRRGVYGNFMYINHIGENVYTIFDRDYDGGCYPYFVSKNNYTLVRKAYNAYLIRKYHKKVRYELRERIEEAAREEQRRRPPAFVIKGNSKPTNPWKKL